MRSKRIVDGEKRSWVWSWLLLLALLLFLIKLFVLGTYYLENPKRVLFVSLQSLPKSVGDDILIELGEKSIALAKYIEYSGDSVMVQVNGELILIDAQQIRGTVIQSVRL